MSGVRYLSIASGIEGATEAWEPLGWTPVGFSEIDPAASRVLAHHYPSVHNHGDFTKIFTPPLDRVDVLVGGTPCQAFSIAGGRASLDDARGNLALAYVDLAHELAQGNGLRNALWENVPGVLSMHDNAFGCFVSGLVGAHETLLPTPRPVDGKPNATWRLYTDPALGLPYLVPRWPSVGMVAGPKGRLCWRILDAQYFGLAQRRSRLFVVTDFGRGADPATVLFEREGLFGNTAPSRKAGQGSARNAGSSFKGGGETTRSLNAAIRGVTEDGTGRGCPLVTARLVAFGQYECDDTASTLQSRDWKDATDLIFAPIAFDAWAAGNTGFAISEGVAGALRATNHGGGHAAVAFAINSHAGAADGDQTNRSHASGGPVGLGIQEELAYALRAERTQAVAFDLRGREGGAQFEGPHDTANIRAASGGSSRSYVAVDVRHCTVDDVAQTLVSGDMGNKRGRCINGIPHTFAPATRWAVRRLTPKECERLQGFRDGHTDIPQADGPRYKQIGNSFPVPVIRWLGKRLDAELCKII